MDVAGWTCPAASSWLFIIDGGRWGHEQRWPSALRGTPSLGLHLTGPAGPGSRSVWFPAG